MGEEIGLSVKAVTAMCGVICVISVVYRFVFKAMSLIIWQDFRFGNSVIGVEFPQRPCALHAWRAAVSSI